MMFKANAKDQNSQRLKTETDENAPGDQHRDVADAQPSPRSPPNPVSQHSILLHHHLGDLRIRHGLLLVHCEPRAPRDKPVHLAPGQHARASKLIQTTLTTTTSDRPQPQAQGRGRRGQESRPPHARHLEPQARAALGVERPREVEDGRVRPVRPRGEASAETTPCAITPTTTATATSAATATATATPAPTAAAASPRGPDAAAAAGIPQRLARLREVAQARGAGLVAHQQGVDDRRAEEANVLGGQGDGLTRHGLEPERGQLDEDELRHGGRVGAGGREVEVVQFGGFFCRLSGDKGDGANAEEELLG
ncbi:uncharacterized protein B0I36DRAFT_428760 [Microdochium trichocladiopsis]|uniref:Uncharacterized protein n=1 Tax=Microdochium trichocladiopsis TaxID=1682393 RepID=A0A9P9BYR7_9PEZI|nr:uncharacterized protein B0I36DRAFT_428760 [Microdochium trichocladiopsis]KAH7038308.1 hypothetical protein B0I36DRAFT_428760 [Microdochium trichocladiopsis]